MKQDANADTTTDFTDLIISFGKRSGAFNFCRPLLRDAPEKMLDAITSQTQCFTKDDHSRHLSRESWRAKCELFRRCLGRAHQEDGSA